MVRFTAACSSNIDSGWNNLTPSEQENIVSELERGCYNLAIESAESAGLYCSFDDPAFVSQYSLICARVGSNLDALSDVGQTDLLDRIIDGRVVPKDVARMKSEELWPEASAETREILTLRSQQSNAPKISTLHTCKKCGCRETTKMEYQSRASDEASSISIKCTNEACGHTWRMH